MSGNQKQAAAGGPQTQQRFPASSFPQIPQQQPRTDGYHVSTPTFVPQQQGNQTGSQGPALRGIAPTGPPNQASTPPNSDIKVQSVPQQSMNIFVNQNPVRGQQQPFYRPTVPTTQTPRMPNRQGQQPPMYPQQSFMHMPMPPVYITTNPVHAQYYNTGQRPQQFVQQPMPVYSHNTLSYSTYPATPAQSSSVPYNYYLNMNRQGSQPQNNSVPPNPVQSSMPTIAMQPPVQQQSSHQRSHNKRRPKAIAIIDPETGVDRLNEVLDQDNSHPPSGESSARQTPQPTPHNPNKEVQAAFAKQVAQAISTDENAQEEIIDPHPVLSDHLDDPQSHYKAVHNTHRIDVQSSNLKAQAKEFVSTAKESTPVVSAICDAVEVTLPNKQPKDRESPAKGRKQSTREHKDSIKDFSSKDIVASEKHSAIVVVKDDNVKQQKELPAPVSVPSSNKDSLSHQRDDKKLQQKKESKIEKVPGIEAVVESVPVTIVHATQSPAQDASANAKSKQNASQRAKEPQKQQLPQPQPNQKQNVVVPPPQPAKANNKSSKKTDLNLKGANKEGTDMDAFNDNVISDTVNANVNVNSNNDIINANAVVPNSNNSTPNVLQNVTANDIEKTESNEVPTIKTEVKPFDITSIVKEPIKIIKPFTDSQDEPDRAALTNEKIVQAKNEVNNKINDNDNPSKPNILYKEGQWSPENLDGKKKYDINFLLSLRETGASKKKPDNLPDIVIADVRGRMSDGRFSVGGGRDYGNPPFSYGGKSGSQRGLPQKRNSQSGKLGGGGGKGSKSNNVTKVSISLREDVKLNEVENAWRPARFKKGEDMSDEEKKTEDLYKKVRGVLNKLTPQKFATLISQVRCLQIDTAERLQGVIDLVFEKAVDEPNFSVAYANMCSELGLMQVPTANSTEENKEYVNFRKLLVTRCQMEFEKQSIDETVRDLKLKEIIAEPDQEKKKVLQDELDEYDRKLRMKSVGNIRFIGELFKQSMLTAKIMHRCLNNLIESKEEESLECLCKLLSTVGKELEMKKSVDLSPIFNTMKDIVDKKHGKVSSRVRFMLLDAIDLRRNKWVPRRQDLNPKTIDQIQKEHETEQMNIQVMNSVPSTPRKDDRGNSGPNSERKRGGRTATSDDGWITTRGSSRAGQINVQSDKLKTKTPQMDEPLGSSHMFGNWVRGSNIKTTSSSTLSTNTANKYSALENIETDKKSFGSKSSRDPYSSKGPSMERSFKQSYDGRGSRSGSQHRSNTNSTPSSQRSTPAPVPNIPKPTAQQQQPAATQQVLVAELSDDKLERHVQNNLEEFLNESCSIEEYDYETRTHVPPSYFPRLVADGYLHVLDRSSHARIKTGKLFASLIKLRTLPLEDYCIGLDEVLAQADDLAIDIPKIWDYLAEILVHLLCEEALPLQQLHICLSKGQNHAIKILKPLFKMVIAEKGPNFLQNSWQKSGLSFADFMPASDVDNFVASNDFGFLAGGQAPIGQSELSYAQIEDKLLLFFESKATFDDILNWIMANVGERVKENKFIRMLATTIFKNSIKNDLKLVVETLQGHYKLLQKFVDNNATYELQCLYALQSLVHKLMHPKGLLLAICNQLYDDGAFSQESFIAWEVSTDVSEQEGKGVALKQLTSFFTQLKENDEDDEEEEDDYPSSSEDA